MITEYEPESDIVEGEEIEDLDFDEPPEVEEEDIEYEVPEEAEEKEEETVAEPEPKPEPVVPYTKETVANIPSEKPYTHETIANIRELHFNPEPIIIQPRMDKAKRSNANNLIS